MVPEFDKSNSVHPNSASTQSSNVKVRMTWETKVTNVKPDNLQIAGYPLQDLVEKKKFLEVAYLIVKGELPDIDAHQRMEIIAIGAAELPAQKIEKLADDDISKTLAAYLLTDTGLAKYSNENPQDKTAYALGRTARYLAEIYGNEINVSCFSDMIYQAFTGNEKMNFMESRLLEAMITACVDHGVTPPSAQATLIASSTRAAYEVAVAHGVGAITDVHGGAGAKAAKFFDECLDSYDGQLDKIIKQYSQQKKRIAGLGHRVHKNDPRRDILWKLADESGISGNRVKLSKEVSLVFNDITGKDLPINVDGVIGAIVADFGLDISAAKAIFIFGRVAGLSAHYYEEISTQPKMRRINFADAEYAGPGERQVE